MSPGISQKEMDVILNTSIEELMSGERTIFNDANKKNKHSTKDIRKACLNFVNLLIAKSNLFSDAYGISNDLMIKVSEVERKLINFESVPKLYDGVNAFLRISANRTTFLRNPNIFLVKIGSLINHVIKIYREA